MRRFVSSMIDLGVAVKTGGACGGLRSFSGAMLAVVSGLKTRWIVGHVGGGATGLQDGRTWVRMAESRKVGEIRRGARVKRMPTRRTRRWRSRSE